MLDRVLGPENMTVNRIEVFCFLEWLYIQMGHRTNKYETNAGSYKCYKEKLCR